MEAGLWMPINDYSRMKNISISTIRRYIKAGKVQHKKENGKYFIYTIWTGEEAPNIEALEINNLQRENEELRKQVRMLTQEINDLRMLVSIYEKNADFKFPVLSPTAHKGSHTGSLPDLPAVD
jgi:hypothetical protein